MMEINIKHPDLPFTVAGDTVRQPNGQVEPLRTDNLALVQVFLLNQILETLNLIYKLLQSDEELPEPPPQEQIEAD